MDYQLIHSVVNGIYQDLPTINTVPSTYLADLRSYAGICDGLETDIGSGFSFFTLRSPGTPSAAFFNYISRKRNALYPCNFVQSTGWQIQDAVLLNSFDEILEKPFYSESQVDTLAETGALPSPEEPAEKRKLQKVEIHSTALRAIVYGCMLHWLSGAASVRIAVGSEYLSEYNEYVLSVVRKIYSYFPERMREEISFCSFLTSARSTSAHRFSLQFMPERYADSKTIFLDGSSSSAYFSIPNTTGMKELDKMLDYLLGLESRKERKKFLSEIFDSVEKAEGEGKAFSPMNYRIIGSGLALLEKTDNVQQRIPQWIRYTKEKEKYGSVADRIDEQIREQLTPDELRRYVVSNAGKLTSPTKILEFEMPLLKLSREHTDCQEAIWEDLNERLNHYAAKDVYSAILESREALEIEIGTKNIRELLRKWGERAADEQEKETEKELDVLAAKENDIKTLKAALEQECAAFDQKIKDYSDGEYRKTVRSRLDEKAADLVAARIAVKLSENLKLQTNNQKEINRALGEIDNIEKLLPKTQTDAVIKLSETLRVQKAKLKETLTSSETISSDLIDTINKSKNYFEALSSMERVNFGRLSDADKDAVKNQIMRKRPNTLKEYKKAFKEFSGKQLNYGVLMEKNGIFERFVMSDLTTFYKKPIPFTLQGKGTRDSLLKRLHAEQSIGAFLGIREITFSLEDEGNAETASDTELEQLLSLRVFEGRNISESRYKEVGQLLLQANVYCRRDLRGLMGVTEELGEGFSMLTRSVLCGCLEDMTKKDYDEYLEWLIEVLVETKKFNNKKEVINWINKRSEDVRKFDDITDLAEASLKKLNGREQKLKRGKRKKIILSAVLVLGVAAGILVSLKYIGSVRVKEQEIAKRNEELNALVNLDLRDNPDLETLNPIKDLTKLRTLSLQNNIGLNAEDIADLNSMDNLRSLDLRGISNLTKDDIDATSEKNPDCVILWGEVNAEKLTYSGNTFCTGYTEWTLDLSLSSDGLTPLDDYVDLLTTLKKITLIGTIREEDFDILAKLKNLKELDLIGAPLGVEELNRLTDKVKNLTVLSLSESDMESAKTTEVSGIAVIVDKVYLVNTTTELTENREVNQNDLNNIAKLTVLTKLNLSAPKSEQPANISEGDTAESDGEDQSKQQETSLESSDLSFLNGLPNLEELSLANRKLDETALFSENGSAAVWLLQENLKKLGLSNTGITRIPDLRESSLQEVDLSDNLFGTLDTNANNSLGCVEGGFHFYLDKDDLEILNLSNTGIDRLPLDDNRVGQVRYLKKLYLSGNKLDTNQLGRFKMLPESLTYLDLSGTGITEDTTISLSNQGCEIIYYKYNETENTGEQGVQTPQQA